MSVTDTDVFRARSLTRNSSGGRSQNDLRRQRVAMGRSIRACLRGRCDGFGPMGDEFFTNSMFFPRNTRVEKNMEMTVNPSQPVTEASRTGPHGVPRMALLERRVS